jgi:hypothetical protein
VARVAVFEYLGGFYNRRRLCFTFDCLSPEDFEEGRMRESGAA